MYLNICCKFVECYYLFAFCMQVLSATKLYSLLSGSSLLHYLFSLGNSACVDVASMMDVSRVCPGNMDRPACVLLPPTKRSKLYAFFVL